LPPVPSETDWARLKDDEGKLNDALLEPKNAGLAKQTNNRACHGNSADFRM
jgi:hypothetical protein